MLTHQAFLVADHVANLQAAGGIGGAFKTAGKAILIFLVVIFAVGALVGLAIGFFIGRAVGRNQGAPAENENVGLNPN